MPGGDDAPADCVKVAVRCRPPSNKEQAAGEKCIVEMNESYTEGGESGQVVLFDPEEKEEPAKFAFDIVFGLAVEQVQIYHSVGRPALFKTFEGYNGTIFAYGQTGSGKSFTMGGVPGGDLRGITPRVNEELFMQIAERQSSNPNMKFLVMCSYFEIYNEIIFDLLNPVADRAKLGGGLQIKEHPVLGIYVKDLTEIVSEDKDKLDAMIDSGAKNRAVSSTMMNSVSSRSHSIFTIKLHQKDDEDKSRNVFAKLNLVDLAGSERQKGTGATGQTLKEGANINKSLSALGNVINALVENANGKKVFIPYRNSKLTRVLQESLGGNSLCTMLATLSPAACNYEETMSTLRYANRAKAIKVSATKNEEASQISRLKAEVEELKKKLAGAGTGGGPGGLTDAEREQERFKHEKQLQEMQQMISNSWDDKAKLSEEHERKMRKLAEERRNAAQALEEERSKRLQLLQEKNDLELSVKGLVDFLLHVPKPGSKATAELSSLLSGDAPRQWLKNHRTMRQHLEQLREQRTLVLVFQHAFHEDLRLWGEGVEADDLTLALGGLNRTMPKLDKLRKGGEKLQQLEAQGLAAASELTESVRVSMIELDKFRASLAHDVDNDERTDAAGANNEDVKPGSKATLATSLDQVGRILHMVQKQAQEKSDELAELASLNLGETCGLVLRSARSCPGHAEDNESRHHCDVLQALVADPRLAALPSCMPAKPLSEYDATDVLDTPETTEALIGQLIRWEGLCNVGKTRKSASELLSRPPPKFLLDVTLAIKAATGFPPDLQGDWPENRDERLARFQSIAQAVADRLSITIDFEPADVLKGKEVPKTLRLLQLVAVAAAKLPPGPQPPDAPASSQARHGVARPRELPPLLDAVGKCISSAKGLVNARAQSAPGGMVEQPDVEEEGLSERISALEQQLQEEQGAKLSKEAMMLDMERQLEEAQAEVRKVANEAAIIDKSGGADPELVELERQLQELMGHNAPDDLEEEALMKMLTTQLEEVRRELDRDMASVQDLETKQQELERSLNESSKTKAQLEAEVQLERQKVEIEAQLAGQNPEDQKLILEAHEQKLKNRAAALQDQIAQMQAEAEERKANVLSKIQEQKDIEKAAEEAQLQMQIVQEERDAMREAMEQLWNEWSAIDEELTRQEQAYIFLSERLEERQDEYNELECLVERKRSEVAALQKNGFY